MDKQELFYTVKRAFNFHPDEEVHSVEEILEAAREIEIESRIQMFAYLTPILARYIDKQDVENTDLQQRLVREQSLTDKHRDAGIKAAVRAEKASAQVQRYRLWKEGAINFYPDLERMEMAETVLADDKAEPVVPYNIPLLLEVVEAAKWVHETQVSKDTENQFYHTAKVVAIEKLEAALAALPEAPK